MTGASAGIRKTLASHRRVVVKIGSALLVDRKTGLKSAWLDSVCSDIAALKAAGVDVLVVSSGAIALGRTVLDLPSRPLQRSARSPLPAHGRKACRGMGSSPVRSC
jgi:glutamate 5-kinase